MRSWKHNSKGFTLITTLILLFLLSGLAIGMLMMVNTEVKVGTQDVQNNVTFHAAEGAIEKMTADLSNTLEATLSPSVGDITTLATAPGPPVLPGITFPNPGAAFPNGGYTFSPVVCTGPNTPAPNCTGANVGAIAFTPGVVPYGNFAGLNATLMNVQLQATAQGVLGDEVSMSRTVEVAFIPVFQFGIFCEGDCGFFAGPPFDFAGRVHTNGDLYLAEGAGNSLTFHSKISAYGNVVRQQLSNGNTIGSNSSTGQVLIPTAASGCDGAQPACRGMAPTEGSVVAGPTSAYNGPGPPDWQNISLTTYTGLVIDGNNGKPKGTGATKLTLPFVNGANATGQGPQNFEIIRRPTAGDPATLSASRLYNTAQIRVLLSDNPDELPCGNPSKPPAVGCGSTDANNIRLANVNDKDNTVDNSHGVNQTGLAKLGDGGWQNLYFATANSAIPKPQFGGATQVAADWEFGPLNPFPAYTINGNAFNTNTITVDPGNVLANAPYVLMDGTASSAAIGKAPPADFLVLCNPAGTTTQTAITTTNSQPAAPSPPYCPDLGSYPYYSLAATATGTSGYPALTLPYPSPAGSAAVITTSNASQSAWNLLDGYLRVEYRDAAGNYHPVTLEWLQLGFARGTLPPTAPGTNPITPNAILIFQQPADRNADLNPDPAGAPPSYSQSVSSTCSKKSGSPLKCVQWTWTFTYTAVPGTPPEVVKDSNTGNAWFGDSKQVGQQSPTQYSWYPINFYDPREGEVRDGGGAPANPPAGSCTPNGVMNAVELDVGNLKQWLAGAIGASGGLVESQSQNGYILYFSDRRGMLPNPNGTQLPGTANTKTGDSGLEDVVNSGSAAGTPDGALEPKAFGKSFSPEDPNLNGSLDNWGAANLGLGLGYNLALPTAAGTAYPAASNINRVVNSGANPDPYMTGTANRISSCAVGQGNWVSGARHALKLVDGSLGNLPLKPGGGGGFTVGSENPVYVQGDYNSNNTDASFGGGADTLGMAAAGIVADTVTLLSDNWRDWNSIVLDPMNLGNRNAATSYYRVAIAAGKNINFPYPGNGTANDFGTDGGVHNFLRYIENWGCCTLWYRGSIASLYYSTYATGVYKCCSVVYSPPTRAYSFDTDFNTINGLPPGTPTFRDIDNLSYRQSFTPCTVGANGLCTN
jgi:type II secretory pathway pseudopilin PulG